MVRRSVLSGGVLLITAACTPSEMNVTAREPARPQKDGGRCRVADEPYNAFTARILSLEDLDDQRVSVIWQGELAPVSWRLERDYLGRCATFGPRPGSDFVVGYHSAGSCSPILRALECSAVPPAEHSDSLPPRPLPTEGAVVSDEPGYGLRAGRREERAYSIAAVRPCDKGACAGPQRSLDGRVVAIHAVDLASREARPLGHGSQTGLPPTAKQPAGFVRLEQRQGTLTVTTVVAFGLVDDQPLAFERNGETTTSPRLAATRSDGTGLSLDSLELAFDESGQPLLRAKTRASPSLLNGGSGERVDTWRIVAVKAP